jgi:hypothetical protein
MLLMVTTPLLRMFFQNLNLQNYHSKYSFRFCSLPPLKIIQYLTIGGPGGSVGIATGYGLDGTGIKKKIPGGARFFAHVQTGPGVHPAFCTMGTGSFPWVKRPGLGAEHPPPSSAEVENE